MIHRILTCRNHPQLRWTCKDIAWTGSYNGTRNIFFNGEPNGRGMYSDGSGLQCSPVIDDPEGPHEVDGKRYRVVEECRCSASMLILAPEDELVRRS